MGCRAVCACMRVCSLAGGLLNFTTRHLNLKKGVSNNREPGKSDSQVLLRDSAATPHPYLPPPLPANTSPTAPKKKVELEWWGWGWGWGYGGLCPNLSFSPPALIALFCREIVAAATTARYSCCRFGPADSTLISAKKTRKRKSSRRYRVEEK